MFHHYNFNAFAAASGFIIVVCLQPLIFINRLSNLTYFSFQNSGLKANPIKENENVFYISHLSIPEVNRLDSFLKKMGILEMNDKICFSFHIFLRCRDFCEYLNGTETYFYEFQMKTFLLLLWDLDRLVWVTRVGYLGWLFYLCRQGNL